MCVFFDGKMLFIPSLKLTSNVRTCTRDRRPIVTEPLIVAVKGLNKLLGVFILRFHNCIVHHWSRVLFFWDLDILWVFIAIIGDKR